jgi:hypothetical protein
MNVEIFHPTKLDVRVSTYQKEDKSTFATLNIKTEDGSLTFYLNGLDQVLDIAEKICAQTMTACHEDVNKNTEEPEKDYIEEAKELKEQSTSQ